MGRPVTLVTGQWADLPLAELAPMAAGFGYDGLELACWGDHFEVAKAAESKAYCDDKRALLDKHGLSVWAIAAHLAGQLVCDNLDERHKMFSPESTHGSCDSMRAWAIEEMKLTARAAANLGVKVVNGFTGSSIWHLLYGFPPVSGEMIDDGFKDFADKWNPILDVFDECGVRFGLEVHPTEIAFDTYTAERAVEAIGGREAFGFNFDPSHLHWQGVDSTSFIDTFPDRIYHVHMKDAIRMGDAKMHPDPKAGILGSHLDFGDSHRGWDFRSLGRGGVDFESIIRALNRAKYSGPLSVEWEDTGMDREVGAAEACQFVRDVDFQPSDVAFDAAFDD